MSRLIDADDVKKRYNLSITNDSIDASLVEFVKKIVSDVLDDAPTVDAVPVKHGHWIKDNKRMVYQCSVCHGSFQEIGYGFNFCPECGAKMDEKVIE